jgi:4-amino-4-deoxy-L-arabinose transferase-like glycosyltransferase
MLSLRWLFVGVWISLFFLRAMIYLAITPPWQAPDEPTSMELLLTMEARGRLVSPADTDLDIQRAIVASMQRSQYWDLGGYGYPPKVPNPTFSAVYSCCGTQLHRPPLYHMLVLPAAKLTHGWLLEHRLIALRAVSILFGLLTVAIVSLVGYELAVVHPALPLILPALVTFHPQFAYSSATFNSDNLVAVLGALFFLILLRAMQRGLSIGRLLLLVGIIGLGFFTKRTIVFLVPTLGMAVLGQAIQVWRDHGRAARRMVGVGGIVAALVMLAVAAVPPLRLAVYGFASRFLFFADPIAYLGFISQGMFAASIPLTTWLGTSVPFLNRSFWASYGWHQVSIPASVGHMLMGVVLATWITTLIWLVARRRQVPNWFQRYVALCALAIGTALTVALLNAPAPVLPQGRYLFLVLIPMLLMMAIGLCSWWPRRWTPYGVGVVWLALIALDVYTLTMVFIPGFYR